MALEAAIEAYKHGDWAEAVRICEKAIAESAGDELQVCRLRLILSQSNWALGRIQEAFALPAPTDERDVEIAARIRNQMGFLLAQTGKFQEAKAELQEALRLSEAVGIGTLTFGIQITRATLFFYLTDYDSMLACGRAALATAEKSDLPRGSAYAVMGKNFMVRKQWTEAIAWYERALLAFEADDSPFYVDRIRSELGCCYFGRGELVKAMEFYTEALHSSEKAGALASMHTDHANIGAVHLRRGEYATSLSHFRKALEIASALGDHISVGKWPQNLSLAYRCMGDTMQATSCDLEAERIN